MFSDTASAPPADLIKEGSDATFMADVIEASKVQPVIVDFWATWCGPCRTLGPMLEQAVRAAGGAVKMVKIDVDKNPAYAGQLRVQSIPTVYAFVNGQPVDGFQGAVPESQIKAFIDKLTGGSSGESDIDQLLSMGAESLKVEDLGGAAQAYAQVLQLQPDNEKAIAGMARVYLNGGDADQARQTLAMAKPDSRDPEILGVRAALDLAADGPSDTAKLETRVQADPTDLQARFDLAGALAAAGRFDGAADHLLAIIAADRDWNDQAARKQLLTIFEAAGVNSDVAKNGRRKLSSILFS